MNSNQPSPGELTALALLMLDVVDSTNLEKSLGKEKARACMIEVRNVVGQAFEDFGARRGGESWQGDGVCAYFIGAEPAQRAVGAAMRAVELVRTLPVFDVQVRVAVGLDYISYQENLGEVTSTEFNNAGHLAAKDVCPPNAVCITENVYLTIAASDKEMAGKFSYRGVTRRDTAAVFSCPHGKAPARPGGLLSGNEDTYTVFRSLMAYYRRPPFSALRFYALPQFNFVKSLDLGRVFTPLNVRRRSHFRDVFIEDFEHWGQGRDRDEDGKSGIEEDDFDRQQAISDEDRFFNLPIYAASNRTGHCESFSPVFERERLLVVLGDPGSGKTTLLRWLAWVTSGGLPETARHLGVRERLLPVYAPAARLLSMRKGAADSCMDLLARCCGSDTGVDEDSIKTALEQRMAKGELLLLIDGLDEMPEANEREEASRLVSTLVSTYPGNRMVTASRIVGYPGVTASGAEEVILEPLTLEQTKRLARSFYVEFYSSQDFPEAEKLGTEKGGGLAAALALRQNLSVFAGNPLLLTLAALVHVQLGELPRFRVKLYDVAFQTLSTAWAKARGAVWDRSTGLPPPLDYDLEAMRVLPALAYWMHKHCPGGLIKSNVLMDRIVELLPKEYIEAGPDPFKDKNRARTFLKSLNDAGSLLVERGSGEWAFIHQTFQEYLAAKHLAMTDGHEDALKENLYSPRWKEVWRLLAGELGVMQGRTIAAAKFIERILDDTRDVPPAELKINLLLGAECLADTVAEDKTTKRIFNELNTLITDSREPPSRKWLHETLRQLAATPLGSSLAEVLKHKVLDDTGMERKRVTAALAALGYRDVPPGILEVLQNRNENTKQRAEVCSVIGRLKAEGAAQNLLEIMHDKHESIDIRGGAVIALANLGTREAEAEFLSIIRNREEDEYLRYMALIALRFKENKEAVPELVKIIKNRRESNSIRQEACFALGILGAREAVPELLGIAKNQDEHKWVRGKAISAIRHLEAIEAIPELVEMLRDEHEDEHIRQFILHSMRELKLKDKEAVPELVDLLRKKQGENYELRKIILALGDLGAGQAIPDLLEILNSNKENPQLYETAGEALVKLGARDVAPQLQEILKDKGKSLSAHVAAWDAYCRLA